MWVSTQHFSKVWQSNKNDGDTIQLNKKSSYLPATFTGNFKTKNLFTNNAIKSEDRGIKFTYADFQVGFKVFYPSTNTKVTTIIDVGQRFI